MKLQLLASAALMLLSAVPGVFSEVSVQYDVIHEMYDNDIAI